MSENETKQERIEAEPDVLNIRYFAERMLKGVFENDIEFQQQTLFELAKLASVHNALYPVRVYGRIVDLWNLGTWELRNKEVSDDAARQTVFQVIGEIFGKYGLNGGYYEEDEP